MPFGAFPPATRRRVVVSGLGMVTPLGITVEHVWSSLCSGRSGTCALHDVPYFFPPALESDRRLSPEQRAARRAEIVAALPSKVAGAVRSGAGEPNFAPTSHEPRATAFAKHATVDALKDAGLLGASDPDGSGELAVRVASLDRIGANLGVGMPSLADVSDVALYLYAEPDKVHYSKINPFFVPKILGNMVAGAVAIRHGLRGPIGSSVAACATGAHCIGEAAEWIRAGRADVMVCGASEACITPISVAGFSRMRALCTRYNNSPTTASRPFDKERGGFVIGEGAGVMVLEELEHARARHVRHIYGELRGFGVSCDAYHVAAPHPEGRGARRCVEEALRDGCNVPPPAVGYVNAHATGTIGDDIELKALEQALCGPAGSCRVDADSTPAGGVLRRQPLHISSSKGAFGHLLGAAGGVEACVAVLSLDRQLAPPTANLSKPRITADQVSKGMHLVAGDSPAVLDSCEAVLSTSFGFGGVNTALLFTKV